MFCAAFLKITLFFLVHKRIFFEWHDELKKPKSNRTKNEISKIVVQFNWSADVTEAFRILRILFFCALSLRDFFRWQLFFLAIKMNFWVQFNMEKIMRTTNGKKISRWFFEKSGSWRKHGWCNPTWIELSMMCRFLLQPIKYMQLNNELSRHFHREIWWEKCFLYIK